jgi:hypothetical protein
MSVTLIEIPSPIRRLTAGIPSAVAGTLTSRLGRSIRFTHSRASATVASVSRASSGSTSTDTNPSAPSDASHTGRSTSQARRMSSPMRDATISTGSASRAAISASWRS